VLGAGRSEVSRCGAVTKSKISNPKSERLDGTRSSSSAAHRIGQPDVALIRGVRIDCGGPHLALGQPVDEAGRRDGPG
jgi:hypothetical protein